MKPQTSIHLQAYTASGRRDTSYPTIGWLCLDFMNFTNIVGLCASPKVTFLNSYL